MVRLTVIKQLFLSKVARPKQPDNTTKVVFYTYFPHKAGKSCKKQQM